MQYFARLGAISIGLALNGCAIHPLPEDVTRQSTLDIVENIRCEARQAVIERAMPNTLDSTYIAYEFLFNIREDNTNAGEAIFKYPFTNGTFTLGFTGGMDKQRITNRNFRIVETFADLKKARCPEHALPRNPKYPIAGNVGLYEVVETYIRLEDLTDLTPKSDVPAFSDKLMYTTTVRAGVHPIVEIAPVTKRFRLAKGELDLKVERQDLHQVTVALSVDKKKQRPIIRRGGGIGIMSTPSTSSVIQSEADARGRVLLELDRQRALDLNRALFNTLGLF